MPPINFPDSPAVNDTFTEGGRSWTWTGTTWNIVRVQQVTGPTGPPGVVSATSPINYNSDTQTVSLAATPLAASTTTAATGFGYMGLPQNETTTGPYTLAAADAGKHIYASATRTVTIPPNTGAGSVAFPVGTAISFLAGSGATLTIAITTDTLQLVGAPSANTAGTSRTLAQFGMATAVKVAPTIWYISGNGLT